VIIEAAKVTRNRSARLKEIYDKVKQNKNANAATIAVARKLVNYLMAVDKTGKSFVVEEFSVSHWEKFINKNRTKIVVFPLKNCTLAQIQRTRFR